MLRLITLLLVLANLGYFAFGEGLLAPLGLLPAVQREPQRLEQQIKPAAVRVLGADEARRAEVLAAAAGATAGTASPATPVCLVSGLLDAGQSEALRPLLEANLPAGAWTFDSVTEPARWIVYMGKYPNADAVTRKKAELRQINVSFEALVNPTLEPGLSLGHFGTEAEARDALARLTARGVRTARVQLERAETRGQSLRLPALDEAARARLDALKPALGSKTLRPC